MDTSIEGQNERARQGLSRASTAYQSRTDRCGRQQKTAWAAALLVSCAVARALAQPPGGPWPAFLGPPDGFAPEVVAAVERVFRDLTLSRTVEGRAARVPFESYVVFVDAPDVTAAAARFRRLARYEVQALGEDWYRADDRAGARGLYRVLLRDRTRRVILSWGEHTGSLLGTISGSALTLLELDPRDGQVGQRITVYVQIDQAFAAALARLLVVVFGGIADRKLTEGFTVAARVAEWAVEHPGEFCPWLRAETSLDPARRERVLAAVPGCR